MADEYFTDQAINRQLLLWAIATRRQLERWEPLVAWNLRADLGGPSFPDRLIWEAATEHHFLLIAARNLLHALELAGNDLGLDATIRAELIEGRDLHEHWVENAPVFNQWPRRREPPRKSGKEFAARNPTRGPYSWFGWDSRDGPWVLPNVPAHAIHELIDRVESMVVERDSALKRFIPEPQPSPWFGQSAGKDRWWPRPPDPSGTD